MTEPNIITLGKFLHTTNVNRNSELLDANSHILLSYTVASTDIKRLILRNLFIVRKSVELQPWIQRSSPQNRVSRCNSRCIQDGRRLGYALVAAYPTPLFSGVLLVNLDCLEHGCGGLSSTQALLMLHGETVRLCDRHVYKLNLESETHPRQFHKFC